MHGLTRWHLQWMNAIANAWSVEGYEADLVANPQQLFEGLGVLGDYIQLSINNRHGPGDGWKQGFWTLPYAELTIKLPVKPDDKDLAVALAAYTRQITEAILGVDLAPGAVPRPVESPLPALEHLFRWMHIMPQMIAMAWRDEEFKNHLLEDAHLTLWNAFAFLVPGGVQFTVEEDPSFVWSGKTWALPKLQVTMNLPPKPAVEDQAVALGEYGQSGRSTPFTACC